MINTVKEKLYWTISVEGLVVTYCFNNKYNYNNHKAQQPVGIHVQ